MSADFFGRTAPESPRERGFDRREFVKTVTLAAASVGLSASAAMKIAEAAASGLKPSVIWLHFQECTGCTESLLRTSAPSISKLILDLVSLDYHETLAAAAGHQIEGALKAAMAGRADAQAHDGEGARLVVPLEGRRPQDFQRRGRPRQ